MIYYEYYYEYYYATTTILTTMVLLYYYTNTTMNTTMIHWIMPVSGTMFEYVLEKQTISNNLQYDDYCCLIHYQIEDLIIWSNFNLDWWVAIFWTTRFAWFVPGDVQQEKVRCNEEGVRTERAVRLWDSSNHF